MWSSVVNGLNGIIEKITNIPTLISEIIQGIVTLPDKIIEGLKGLIVPEDGYIESKIDELSQRLSAIGVSTFNMSGIMGSETALADITGTYRGTSVTFVDMDVVVTVVAKFRPVIRGFMWLMLVLYNYNQFMGLIGQHSLTLGNMIKNIGGKDE